MSDVFFFQAEDGIRDLVRSRGLGDVYKRQEQFCAIAFDKPGIRRVRVSSVRGADTDAMITRWAVSYTHLTLPTSDLV